MYKQFSRYPCSSPMEISSEFCACPSTPMANQKESGTTELRVHQHGWADLPVPNSPNLVRESTVDGWLIFSAIPIMRWDGGRGKELLESNGVSVTRCQNESEGQPSSREFFSPPLGRLGTPKVVDDV